MNTESSLHIAIMAYQAWGARALATSSIYDADACQGHTRPLCALAARMTKLRPIDITFFTSCQMYPRVVTEIARNFDDDEEEQKRRIRIVGLIAHEQNMFDVETVGKSFASEFQKLVVGKPVRCCKMNVDIPALVPPRTLLVDIFGYDFMCIARGQNADVKVFAWIPGSLVSLNGLFGPFKPNTVGDMQRKVNDLAASSGVSLIEAAQVVFNTPTDDIMRAPGLPPVFWYENFPQEPLIKIPCVGLLHLGAHNLIQESDGCITAALETLEPSEVVQTMGEYFMATSRKLHVVGPLLPSTKKAAVIEMEQAVKSPEITAFMDEAQLAHGERSLIYISFGTVFWTTQPEKVWTFLDVLIERGIPFIMSQASAFSQVPDEVGEKVRSSGLGVITAWAPQQAILGHPVTGWFVTHSGFNSFTESIDAGVPMICWPIAADQPLNTIHLVENLDVAYELLEVRSGEGLKPIYRTGRSVSGTLDLLRAEVHNVLDKAFGEDGARKRSNVRRLKDASSRLWDDNGPARRAAEEFLDSLHREERAGDTRPDKTQQQTRTWRRRLTLAYDNLVPSRLLAYFATMVGAPRRLQISGQEPE